jgi:hypothetical protein
MIKQFQHWQRLAPIHFITVASRTTICVLAAWLAVTASAQTPEQTADPLIQFERLMVQIEKKVFASVCNLDELQKKLTDWHPSGDLDKVMEVLAQKYAADLWKEFPETKAAADAYLQQYNPENIFLQSNGNNSDAEKISALQFMAGLNEEAKEQGASPAGAMLLTVMESCRQTMVQMFDDEIFTPLKFRSQFSGEAGGIQQQTKSPETLYAGKDKVSLPSEDSGEKSCNDCLIPQSAFDEGLRKWKKMRAVQTIPSLAMHAQVSWVYEFHKLGVQSVADKATSIVDHKLFRCRSEVECDRSLLGLKKLAETAPQILLEPEIEQTWAKDVQEIKHPTSRRKWVYLFSALTLEAEFNAKIKLGSWDHIGIYVGNGAGASANQISVAWLKDYRSRSQALRQNTELHPFLSAPQIAQAKQNNDAYAETYWTFAYVNKDSQDFDEGGFLFGLSESEAELFPQAFPEDQRMGLIERMRTWNHELLQRTETLRALELYSLRLESKKPYQYLEQMFALLQSEQEKGIGAYWALLSEKFSVGAPLAQA